MVSINVLQNKETKNFLVSFPNNLFFPLQPEATLDLFLISMD